MLLARSVLGVKPVSMVFGYHDSLEKSLALNPLAAGTNSGILYTTASNEVAVFTNLIFSHTQARAGVELFYTVTTSAGNYSVYDQIGVGAGVNYDRQGQFIIKPGGSLKGWVIGATAGDAAYFTALGYSMLLG